VSLYDWLLALHVLSAFAWVSALVVYSMVLAASWGASVPTDVARMFRITKVGDVLIAVGMIGTIVFGVWLALDEYEIWDGWIIAALLLWVAAAATGGRGGKHYNGVRDRANALVAEGRTEPSPELAAGLQSTRALAFHSATVIITVTILVVMIYKPGA
jgi:uncharacterized membrane protein